MNFKYLLGALISIPLLPFMYLDGKRIRANVPQLPEAKQPQGIVKKESEKELQIIILGESTVAGVGVEKHEDGFAGMFSKTLSNKSNKTVNWKVYAKSGYTAKQITRLLVPKINEAYADLIVIGLGGNDAFTLNTPFSWKKDIRSLIEKLRAVYPEAIIAFTNMPPIKEFPAFTPLIKFTIGNLVEILGEELKGLVAQIDNTYYNSEIITIDGWTKKLNLANNPDDFFSDGVHPSKLTYQAWAKDFCDFILEKKVFIN